MTLRFAKLQWQNLYIYIYWNNANAKCLHRLIIVSFVVVTIPLIINTSSLGLSKKQSRNWIDKQNTKDHAQCHLSSVHLLRIAAFVDNSGEPNITSHHCHGTKHLVWWWFPWANAPAEVLNYPLDCIHGFNVNNYKPQPRGLAIWIAQSVNCFIRWKV